jgi:hypothetical protein
MKLYSLDLFKCQNSHGYGRILRLQDSTLQKAHAFIFFIDIVGLLPYARSKGMGVFREFTFIPKSTKPYRSDDSGVIIECDELQQAVTPGQVAVLWEHDWCLGSGVIGATF